MWWDTCVWCVVPGLYTVGASIDHLHQGCACVICAHVKNHIRLRDKYALRHWQRRWLSLSVHFNQPLLLSCGWSLQIQLSGLGIMLFNMCVTFHHDLCCIFSNLVYFIHPGPPTALSSKHISWSHHLVWSVGWCHMFFFGLCGMWLCATNLHMTHMYCNGIHCHLCWLHVPHDMHDSHLPRQCWWAWWINHLFTSWVMKIHSSGLDMVGASLDYLHQGCACVISALWRITYVLNTNVTCIVDRDDGLVCLFISTSHRYYTDQADVWVATVGTVCVL